MKSVIYILIFSLNLSPALSMNIPQVHCTSLKGARNYVSIGEEHRPVVQSLPLTINQTKYEMEVRLSEIGQYRTLLGDLFERTLGKPKSVKQSFELSWSPISVRSPNGILKIYTAGSKGPNPDVYNLNCATTLQIR